MKKTLDPCIQSILDYLRTSVVLDPAEEIPLDESLLETRVLDSYGIVDLLTFIEREFGLTIPDADVTKEKMGSIRKMAQYVETRRQAAA
jgi:acyl carrier protein